MDENEINELIRKGFHQTVSKGKYDEKIIQKVLSYLGIVLNEEQTKLAILTTQVQESSGAAQVEFKKTDLDGNGTIDYNEVKKMNPIFTDSHVKRIMARLDVNKDGVLDFKEFLCLLLIGNAVLVKSGILKPVFQPRKKAKIMDVDEEIRIIAEKTVDKKGKIDATKLQQLMIKLGHMRTLSQIKKAIVSFEALEKKGEVKSLFKMFDTDNSGKLDIEELQKGYLKLKVFFTKEHLAKVIKRLDVNKDGEMDMEEFKVLMLIGSCVRTVS